MEYTALRIDPDYKRQSFTINVQPNGIAQTLRIDLDYRAYAGKYFASVTNADTGEEILINFPLIASYEEGINDLLKQVSYKMCGMMFVYPLVNDTEYPDPNGTISEYEVVWGDSPWI